MGEHNKYRVLDNPRAVEYRYLDGAYRFLSPRAELNVEHRMSIPSINKDRSR
jgi:hypothetical protein